MLFYSKSLYTLNLFQRTKATGAKGNCFGSAVFNYLDLANIRLPSSVCLAVGVGHSVTKNNTFSAYTAFCHSIHLLTVLSDG